MARDKINKNTAFEGFETWVNALKMALKMHGYLLIFTAGVHLTLFYHTVRPSLYEIKALANWAVIHLLKHRPMKFYLPDGRHINASAATIGQIPAINDYIASTLRIYSANLLSTTYVYGIYPLALFFFRRRSATQSGKKHLRGAKIITAWGYKRLMWRRREPKGLPIGHASMPVISQILPRFSQVWTPRGDKSEHILIVGKTGCGKTTAINEMVKILMGKDLRTVYFDFKGCFTAQHYRPDRGDILFNPLDQRAVNWSFFNDLKYISDIHALANSQIPPASGREKFWHDAPRDILIGVIKHLYRKGTTSNRDLWKMVTAPDEAIAQQLLEDGEISAKYLTKPDSDTAKSIISSLTSFLQSYEFLAQDEKKQPLFSIKDWVESGTESIFVSSFAGIRDALKPLISVFLDTLIKAVLDQDDYPKQQTVFIFDEIWTLQRLPALVDLITQGRSKRASLILALQEIGQLEHIYGRNLCDTIVNNCATKVCFAASDDRSAEYVSKIFGEEEVSDVTKNLSLGIEDFKDGININRASATQRRVLLSSEIKNFQNFRAAVQTSGYPSFQVKFDDQSWRRFPDVHPKFLPKSSNAIEKLKPSSPSTKSDDDDLMLTLID